MPETLSSPTRELKKVLMLVHAFPPFRSVGHSIRAVKFIKFLPALGWLPVVLTIDDRHEYETMTKVGSASLFSEIPPQVKVYRTTAGEPSVEFLEKETELAQRNSLTKAVINLLAGARRWAFRTLCLPDRTITWLPFAIKAGREIVKDEGIQAIFATCPPYSVALLGALLKKLTHKPLILDFRDDWIETPTHFSKPRLVRKIESSLEHWAVKTADQVVLVTEGSRNAFLKRYPAEPEAKFIFISNGCDLDEFKLTEPQPSGPRSNPAKFTIVHTGSLNDAKNWARTPMTFFQAIQRILERQPELKTQFTVAFTGVLPDSQKQLAQELGLSEVVKELGFLPRDEWLRWLQTSDLLLVINYDDWATIIPGKIYEYWAVGGPPILLLSCQGAAADLMEKHHLGFTVAPTDLDGIQQAVLTAYRQEQEKTPMRLSTAGIEAYDRRELARKLAQVLSAIQ